MKPRKPASGIQQKSLRAAMGVEVTIDHTEPGQVKTLPKGISHMKTQIITFSLICALVPTVWAQMTVKNRFNVVVMQVDNQAHMTLGSSTLDGDLTTHSLTVLNALTFSPGAASGRVLKSDASGSASWGTDQVDDADHVIGNELQTLSLSGTTLEISDGNSVTLPTGSDNQQLGISGHTLSLDRGGSVTLPDNVNDADHVIGNEYQSLSISGHTISLSDGGGSVTVPDNVNDADHNIGNEYQDLGSSKSGETVSVTITDGNNTSFSIQDDDHVVGNEYQDLSLNNRTLSLSDGGGSVTLGGYAYYPHFYTLFNEQPPAESDFRWYSCSEMGIPSDAKAVVAEAAVYNDPARWSGIVVSTESFTHNDHTSMGNLVESGSHLHAWTEARIEQESTILQLDSACRIYVGHMGIPDDGRVHIFGYFR